MTIKYLSICSGIESVSVAWKPLGWEAMGFSEIDPFRSAILQYHYPEVKNYGDFTKITKESFSETPDVLVGGTPCATFSIAGLRKGLGEDRGNLALEFILLIKRIKPTWVLWENVFGVLSSNGGRDFASFLGALAECGYGFAYRVLDAQYTRTQRFPRAIPQRRRRVFVVGHIGNWKNPAKVLFNTTSMQENPPPIRRKQERIARESTHRLARRGEYVPDGVAGTIAARDWKSSTDLIVEKPPIMVRHSQTGSNGKNWTDEDVSWSLTANDIYTVIETSTPDKTARIYKDEVSPTLTAMTGGNRQPIIFKDHNPDDEDNSLMHYADEIEIVKLRKYKVDILNLQKSLSEGKKRIKYSLKEIAETLDVNLTTVEHWFRTDRSFSIPNENIWFDLKNLLQIETDEFDKSITEFKLEEGKYEMSRRIYSSEGVSPTITANNPETKIAVNTKHPRNHIIRRLTPIETERLQGFPDNYTQIPYRGKPKEECPVSKRYEACGRAMSINVMEYLGERIQKVESKKNG